MARLPRLYAPNTPQLIQARLARPLAGTHEATPAAALDQVQGWLVTEARCPPVALHSWAILPDRVVLLATPADAQALPRLVQGLARQLATHMSPGRVFNERYHSALVADDWLPACMVWTESLPVRHGLVDTPTRWPWSSAQEHTGLRDPGGLTDHPAYWGMGNTPFARQAHYQQLLQSGLSQKENKEIEQALRGQWALGHQDFLAQLVLQGARRPHPVSRGRPRKQHDSNLVTK